MTLGTTLTNNRFKRPENFRCKTKIKFHSKPCSAKTPCSHWESKSDVLTEIFGKNVIRIWKKRHSHPSRIEIRLYIYAQTTIIVRLCTLNIGRPTVRAVCIDAKGSRFDTRPGSRLKNKYFLKIEPIWTKISFVKVTKKPKHVMLNDIRTWMCCVKLWIQHSTRRIRSVHLAQWAMLREHNFE